MWDIFKQTTTKGIRLGIAPIQFIISKSKFQLDEESIRAVLTEIERQVSKHREDDGFVAIWEQTATFLAQLAVSPGLGEATRERIGEMLATLKTAGLEYSKKQARERHQAMLKSLSERLSVVSQTVGEFVEFALHDLANYPQDIGTLRSIYGKVTGRKVGSPMSPAGHAMVLRREAPRINYFSSLQGRDIKSTTILLTDENEQSDSQAYGVLCVNVDLNRLTDKPDEVIEGLKRTQTEDKDRFFANSPDDLVSQLIKQEVGKLREVSDHVARSRFLGHLVKEKSFLFEEKYRELTLKELSPLLLMSSDQLDAAVRVIESSRR